VTGNVANKCSSVWIFEKKTQLECLYKLAAQSLGYWLRGYERGIQQVHCSGTRQLRRGLR